MNGQRTLPGSHPESAKDLKGLNVKRATKTPETVGAITNRPRGNTLYGQHQTQQRAIDNRPYGCRVYVKITSPETIKLKNIQKSD